MPTRRAVPVLTAVLCLLSPAAAVATEGTGAGDITQVVEDPEQKECLAQAIYFEARGETEEAQKAVANVVVNRAEHPEFPETPCGVVRQGGESPPCQFSWWCDGRSDIPEEREAWKTALQIAEEVAGNPQDDGTEGALYFHHLDVRPGWRRAFEKVAVIGAHVYYRDTSADQADATTEEPQVAERTGQDASVD